ncbi:MAG: winged helix-turn-helix transcriptional regulator [Candidatus Omnitrophica bacterium]|nr:winged helix-turn-helix transcriptional regulator [Candidatus Omnitrophota bacterium]
MDEREFELINILGKQLGSNQRDLSRQMDLSLGMVNMLIRRLISKGYIRMDRLNKRNVRYILTPKGITEKLRKSIKYTVNTINSFGLIKGNVKDLIIRLYNEGHRVFYLFCEPDLLVLVESAVKDADLSGIKVIVLHDLSVRMEEGILLTGYENIDVSGFDKNRHVDLLFEIAKTDVTKL